MAKPITASLRQDGKLIRSGTRLQCLRRRLPRQRRLRQPRIFSSKFLSRRGDAKTIFSRPPALRAEGNKNSGEAAENSMRDIEVAAGIIWRGGRFLAARRPPDRPLEGYWEFPGGKLEGGESRLRRLRANWPKSWASACARPRSGKALCTRMRSAGFRVRLHFFHVMAFTGEPCPEEGQNLRWITPAEAGRLAFLPADAGILAQLPPHGPGATE